MSKKLLALVCIIGLMGFGSRVRADDCFPVKVNCNFSFNVKFGPTGNDQPNKAPWYTYFPYDPSVNQPTRAIGTRFPNWPWSPPPCDPTGKTISSQSSYPAWPVQPVAQRESAPSANIILTSGTSSSWRPVAYTPPQAPASMVWYPGYYAPQPGYYWYGR